ncbi:MAG: hypothetical protein DMF89_03075, partial [Acidobacteria bacterium]
MGTAGARGERDARGIHRHPRQRALGDASGSPAARRPDHRRSVHTEGQVRHDAALRPSADRSCRLQAEDLRAGGSSDGAVARRPQEARRHRPG